MNQGSGSYVAWDGQTYQGAPPPGWHLAGDGRWWPAGQGPAAAPAQPAGRPWWKKKRFVIPGGVLALLVVLAAIGGPDEEVDVDAADTTETTAVDGAVTTVLELEGVEYSTEGEVTYASTELGIVLARDEAGCVGSVTDYEIRIRNAEGSEVDISTPIDPQWDGAECVARFDVVIAAHRLTESVTLDVTTPAGVTQVPMSAVDLFAGQASEQPAPVIRP